MAHVYTSTSNPTTSAARVEQWDALSLTLEASQDDVQFCAVAGDQVWAVGVNTKLGNLYALDIADVSSTLVTRSILSSLYQVRSSNGRIYTTCQTGNAATDRVDRINPSDGTSLWTTTGGMGVSPALMVDDGTYVYVAKTGQSPFSVSRLDISTGTIVSTLSLTAGRPADMIVVGGDLFVSYSDNSYLDQIDLASFTVSNTYSVAPVIVGLSTDGTDIFYSEGALFANGFLNRWDVSAGAEAESLGTSSLIYDQTVYAATRLYGLSSGTSASTLSSFRTGPLRLGTATATPAYRNVVDIDLYGTIATGWYIGTIAY
jgi:hypothetical protein